MDGLILLGLLAIGGYVMGIVGFFIANGARSDLQALRREMKARFAAIGAPEVAEAVTPPPASPWATPVVVAPTPPQNLPAPLPPQAPDKPHGDLETMLTARWGIWVGSAALLLAGVFLVRYAVEQSLLGPSLRCVLAALLGTGLIAAAEWLRRASSRALPTLRPDLAPAGLAAGGTAILFAAAYGAGPFYHLLPSLLAFAAMAAASFVGLAAALRFGPLAAAVGIVGAFATPALVTTQTPSLPGLFAYLFVVSVAALAVMRSTAWVWLGWCTAIAGGLWVCLAAMQGGPDIWAAAAFVPTLAALNLVLLPATALEFALGRRLAWVPFAIIGAAGLALEAQSQGAAPRAAVFLLSPLATWRGVTEPRLDRMPWVAAALGLLALLLWALPGWVPLGPSVGIDSLLEPFLPGRWAPDVITSLLASAAAFAGLHALSGLVLERRAPHPLHWAALTAAVPVLTLATTYAQIAYFQTAPAWAATAVLLAAGLSFVAGRDARQAAPQRAGIHAAGATAALALGFGMVLHDHWLTLAVALLLPALAWIEARADLPPLRRVAAAVAVLVLIRLVANWYVLDYAFGRLAIANGLWAAYAAPAASFALAAMLFRRRADDAVVVLLQAGACTLAALFVALEIRHALGNGAMLQPLRFSEVALHALTLALQAVAYLVLAVRVPGPVLQWAWRLLGGAALTVSALLLLLNPALTNAAASMPTLAAAYLLPAGLAVFAATRVSRPGVRNMLAAYAVIAGFAWISLQIRLLFHPTHLGLLDGQVVDAELWAWSGVWLIYGLALMIQGICAQQSALRLAALGVIALVCVKVFLIDMSGLTGLWRVLSFLGLGLGLIGLGVLHRRFVPAAKRP